MSKLEYYKQRNRLCFICKHPVLWEHTYDDEGMMKECDFLYCKSASSGDKIKCVNNTFYRYQKNSGKFFDTCDSFELNSLNIDKIEIMKIDIDNFQVKMYNRKIKICGGDLESLFSSLFGVEEIK